MFKLLNLAGLFAIFVAMGLLAPAPAVAQDCGDYCGPCGSQGELEEGWGEEGNDYAMSCFQEDCADCAKIELVAADVLGAGALADVVSTATAEELPDVLSQYEGRIFVDLERNLLALTGVECSKDEVTSVVFLTDGQTRKFVALDVPPLARLASISK